jgi:hypothetical protein
MRLDLLREIGGVSQLPNISFLTDPPAGGGDQESIKLLILVKYRFLLFPKGCPWHAGIIAQIGL